MALITRIEIDLNVRARGNGTYAGFENVSGPLMVGEEVEVYESESGLAGSGHVTEIDTERELVFLSVDWASLTDRQDPEPSPAGPIVGWGIVAGSVTTGQTPRVGFLVHGGAVNAALNVSHDHYWLRTYPIKPPWPGGGAESVWFIRSPLEITQPDVEHDDSLAVLT
jgi:hypothetical protein